MKKYLPSLLIVIVTVFFLAFLSALVTPKYSEHLIEGGMISEYYDQKIDHEVIFIGDCEVYANINPLVLFEQAGITSYIRGTSQQMIWQSYYVLEETLSYEIPKVVVLNVNAMRYDMQLKEGYNRLATDKMKWSKSKVQMINSSLLPEESFASYVFPLLRYHSRVFELNSEDFRYLFHSKSNTYFGHIVNTDIVPLDKLPAVRPLSDYQFAEKCYEYLDKIRVLCQNNDIELVLMKAPSMYPHWYDEYDKQTQDYANKYSLKYFNFINDIDTMGIDFTTDTYDAGIHLNETGAIKFSNYLANRLVDTFKLNDYRNDNKINIVYAEMLEMYNKNIEK